MNSFGVWYDPTTWFGDSSTDTSSGAGYTGGSDPFGYTFEDWLGGGASTDIVAGVSDKDKYLIDRYVSEGGVLTYNDPSTSSSSDIFSGLGDFFTSLTTNLPGLVNLGLGTWQNVEKFIDAQSQASGTQDRLVVLPGTKTPVVERTQGGNKTYFRMTDLYPSLAPEVQKAQQSSWIGPVLLVGVLGIGAILIFKKK